MAETGKKPVSGSAPPTTDPAPDITRREGEIPDTPNESRNATKLVKTRWPHGRFTVEGIPSVTSEGTKLTNAQLKHVEVAAAASGVSLEVEDVD